MSKILGKLPSLVQCHHSFSLEELARKLPRRFADGFWKNEAIVKHTVRDVRLSVTASSELTGLVLVNTCEHEIPSRDGSLDLEAPEAPEALYLHTSNARLLQFGNRYCQASKRLGVSPRAGLEECQCNRLSKCQALPSISQIVKVRKGVQQLETFWFKHMSTTFHDNLVTNRVQTFSTRINGNPDTSSSLLNLSRCINIKYTSWHIAFPWNLATG